MRIWIIWNEAVALGVKHRGGGEKDIDCRQQSKKDAWMGHKWENIYKQKYALIKFGVVEYKDNILGS